MEQKLYCQVKNGVSIRGPEPRPIGGGADWYEFIDSKMVTFDADTQVRESIMTVDHVYKKVTRTYQVNFKHLSAAKEAVIASNSEACQKQIYSVYPAEFQLSAILGVKSAQELVKVRQYVTACIAEKDRVLALLEDATTVDGLRAVAKADYSGIATK